MADTDLAKLSLPIVVELTMKNPLWNGANPRYKDKSIGCNFLNMTPLEAMFTKMEEYITEIRQQGRRRSLVGVEWWLDGSKFSVRPLSEVSRDSDIVTVSHCRKQAHVRL